MRIIFEDKNLERVLRREEKTGIDLIFGADVILMTAQWMAVFPRHRLTEEYRQTLGAIVEAMGYIPENENVHIRLTKGEYVITHPLPEVIGEDVSSFLPDETWEVKPTGLSAFGWTLFQAEDNTMYGVYQSGPGLNVSGCAVGGGVLVRRDENTGEAVYRKWDRPRADKDPKSLLDNWTYLEGRQWCQWDREPEGEIDGQEMIEDG